MARAPVPTVADFRATAVKPEAFENIPDSVILTYLEENTDYVAGHLGKKAKGIISAWDGSFTKAIKNIAALELMGHRGFKRGTGSDGEISKRAEGSEKWLEKVAEGKVEPYFVDETPDDADDAVLGGSSERADDWTRSRGCGYPEV